jgi:uncharacterized protein YbjQ (UPF0145 family)
MRSIHLFSLVFLAGITCSCGISSNMHSNLNLNNTTVVLSQSNFHIVRTVSSNVSATYVFGIGGLSKSALRSNAIAELTKKADLTGTQALINVTVHTSSKMIFLYSKMTYYAEGTVIEFDGLKPANPPMPEQKELSEDDDNKQVSFNKGNEEVSLKDKAMQSELFKSLMNGSIDKKSRFQAQLHANKLCSEILDDIDNSEVELAEYKYRYLKPWIEKNNVKSEFQKSSMKTIEQKLGL